jgi:arsenate reductase
MKATIWHNPRCSTSRKTLAMLEGAAGVEVEVIEYLVNAPSRERLAGLYERAGITPRQGLRAKEEGAVPYRDADDDAILDAMMRDPILIERPLVETELGVRLCRPQEVVQEILPR